MQQNLIREQCVTVVDILTTNTRQPNTRKYICRDLLHTKMLMTRGSMGWCKICEHKATEIDMVDHIKKHIPDEKGDSHYIISISDGSLFWMCIQVYGNSLLKSMDKFLRREWMECCGHLSVFVIDNTEYLVSLQPGYKSKSMNYKIRNILKEDMTFSYEYDFGTTTHLQMTVVSAKIMPIAKGRGIQVLAIHDPVRFNCAECGRRAIWACSVCCDMEVGMLCKSCGRVHKCGEDMLLPVVQSPRMGSCSYKSGPLTLHNEGTGTQPYYGYWARD